MFKRILIAVDLQHEDHAEAVVRAAQAFAEGAEVEYSLISVVPPLSAGIVSSFLPKNYITQMIDSTRKGLHEFCQRVFENDDCSRVKRIVAHGTIYEEINALADEIDADLVVVNAAKPGGKGIGPNAARVSRYCRKPVMVVR